MDIVLRIPEDIVISLRKNKKWHFALAKINSLRFLLSLYKEVASKKIPICRNDELFINIDEPNITRSILSTIIKNKSLDEIAEHGNVEGIATSLDSNTRRGIKSDVEDLKRRKERFGANTYPAPPTKSLFHFVCESFKDATIFILMICAALSLAFGIKEDGIKEGWYNGGSIFVAVFLVISVSSISNFRQSKQFEKLAEISKNVSVEVVRNGRRQEISIFEVVVGDVVCLKIGDQVPADGLLIEGVSLEVDESSMTGESDHVRVDRDENPFLFSGTKVVDGYGTMLVACVGTSTAWGVMMGTIMSRDVDEQTPLQERLNKLTSSIGRVGLGVASLVLVVLLARYFTGSTTDEHGKKEFDGRRTKTDDVINAVVGIIAAAVTIVVVAIPEGLPLAVTLTLAYSMKRMMADQAMVRKLAACETMGSATTICTDKTGTLTMNQMKVTSFYLGVKLMERETIVPVVLELLHQGVGLNTAGTVCRCDELGGSFEFSGSPTEKAILSWGVLEMGMDVERLRRECTVLCVETFNSEKKASGVLLKNLENGDVHAHWKGGAEMIIAMCSHYHDAEGNLTILDDFQKMRFDETIRGMASNSLRCIAFACKQVINMKEIGGTIPQTGLALLGLAGLKDPCRLGVKEAVHDCRKAGVNVKMITGSNNQELDDGSMVEGVEFRSYTEDERMAKVEKIRVMARSSPFDKLLMVQCLKRKGHVVAVTGDGTNDAPALKEADIGLSMGVQGTEVAKESSDIVILDDNFASVATVLKWGRCVYNNIQKFIQFQLTVNVAALVINFVAAVSSGEVPLTAVQLLWVNLIMDTLGALALATERPSEELMKKRPVGRTEPLITNVMWRNLMAQAMYQIAVLLTLEFRGEAILGINEKVKDTLIFNAFVLCQIFNEFNARKIEKKNVFEGILKNKLFVGIIGVTVVLQVVMVEFLNKFADTKRLNLWEWGMCIGIAAASWPIGFAVKFISVPERPLSSYIKLKNLKFM
ncbi:hypothetical protein ACS0TY_027409 [Phlomoides rotata]